MPLLDISDLKMKAGWRDSQIPPDPSSKNGCIQTQTKWGTVKVDTRLSGKFDYHLSGGGW